MKKTSTVVAPISPSAEKDINSVRLSSSVTVERYRAMELAEDRNGLARFIHERLVERYALPLSLSCRKNGFSMMAASCLVLRKGTLFDSNKHAVNAEIFLKEVGSAVEVYAATLLQTKWDDDLWLNFKNKMNVIIKHCLPNP